MAGEGKFRKSVEVIRNSAALLNIQSRIHQGFTVQCDSILHCSGLKRMLNFDSIPESNDFQGYV
jgi:hypothetical protein